MGSMARNEPSASDLGVAWRAEVAALYLRVATTLERSAELAEEHAARFTAAGRDKLAMDERVQAERSRSAAQRGRDLAARIQSLKV